MKVDITIKHDPASDAFFVRLEDCAEIGITKEQAQQFKAIFMAFASEIEW